MEAGTGYNDCMDKHPKRPRDPSQLAKLMTDIASGEVDDASPHGNSDPAAIKRGRAGGLKGGLVRSKSMTANDRSAAAKKAALKRWGSSS